MMGSTSRDLARVVYEAIPPIKAFNAVPRFGHSADVTILFSDDEEGSVIDYVLGTVFIGAFCLVALLLWMFVLIICKCLGKRAGICAGHPLEQSTFKRGQKTSSCKIMTLRIIMILCSSMIVSSGFIYLFKGAISIRQVFDDMRDVTSGFSKFAKRIIDKTNELIVLGEDTGDIIEILENGICASVSSVAQEQGIQKEFDIVGGQVVEVLNTLGDLSKNELTDLHNVFDTEFGSWIQNIEEYTDAAEKYARPIYTAIPIVVFGFLLMIGCLLAWKGGESCFVSTYFKIQTWLILPLFSILIIVAGIVVSFMGPILVFNSDVCLGGESKSPESVIESFFDTRGDLLDDLTQEALDYYVINGCEGQFSSLKEVDYLVGNLTSAVEGIQDLNDMLLRDQAALESACGGEEGSLDEYKDVLVMSGEKISEFVNISEVAVNSFGCDHINDIYVDLSHDLLCTSMPYSQTWIFATLMSVFMLGMFMVLCRGALLPTHHTHIDIQSLGTPKSEGSEKLHSYDGDVGIVDDKVDSYIDNDPKYDLSGGSGPSNNKKSHKIGRDDGDSDSDPSFEEIWQEDDIDSRQA